MGALLHKSLNPVLFTKIKIFLDEKKIYYFSISVADQDP